MPNHDVIENIKNYELK